MSFAQNFLPMKPQFLLASAIALSFTGFSAIITPAQSVSGSAVRNTDSTDSVDFKLNRDQRRAISGISDFAFDQFDLIIDSGLDPKKLDQKLDRTRRTQQIENVQNLFSAFFQLDDSQKGSLRSVLQKARDQMNRDLQRPANQ
jgi:hypothetical protein